MYNKEKLLKCLTVPENSSVPVEVHLHPSNIVPGGRAKAKSLAALLGPWFELPGDRGGPLNTVCVQLWRYLTSLMI